MNYFIVPGINKQYRSKSMSELNEIAEYCCEFFKISRETFMGKKRNRRITEARFHFMHYARLKEGYNLADIGRCLNKDHTTVMHGVTTMSNLMSVDESYRSQNKKFEMYLNIMMK